MKIEAKSRLTAAPGYVQYEKEVSRMKAAIESLESVKKNLNWLADNGEDSAVRKWEDSASDLIGKMLVDAKKALTHLEGG